LAKEERLKAPFDTHPSIRFATQETRCSGSVASNSNYGLQRKKKKKTHKKANLSAHPLPELVEGGSFINAPFDTLCCSGSGSLNNSFGLQKLKTEMHKNANIYARFRGLSACFLSAKQSKESSRRPDVRQFSPLSVHNFLNTKTFRAIVYNLIMG
jgi:hypothetical protein